MRFMETNEFWKGEFGYVYQERQKQSKVGSVESNVALFNTVFYRSGIANKINSILEMGAGTGQNIRALHQVLPEAQLKSIELNPAAAEQIPFGEVYVGNALEIVWPEADLVLSKGVAVHIPPEEIDIFYDKLYEATNKYILLCEYYNPDPVMVNYRGYTNKLWKRDFAGEILDRYPGLSLVDYGFVYRRDEHPQDDLTWFLLEKTGV